jgi:CheY-like chemotaxis protein
MTIDRATGGLEAVRMAQENHYDFVLMDHMMPGMDGLEATAAIRAWEDSQQALENPALSFGEDETQRNPRKRIPIIALTANAISGMKEMFLEKGFSDYLSKPIEIAKLDEIMTRWIPAEKRIKTGREIKRETFAGERALSIPGVDVKRGIKMTGGTEAGYRKVLAQFCKDAAKRLSVFAAPPAETAANDFATQAHAIKGAAGTIGAAEVSAEAETLETAGKAGDTAAIRKALPLFHERLARLVEGIGTALEEDRKEAKAPPFGEGNEVFVDTLTALRAALETENMKETDRMLEELERIAETEMAEQITDISDRVLMGEYSKAVELITILLAEKEC